jgi:AAA domain
MFVPRNRRMEAATMGSRKRQTILDIRRIADIPKRPLEWLWPGRIPLRKITVLSGDPELGKSLVTLDMAARISSDRDWPDDAVAPRHGRALLMCAEDDVADTIHPRLEWVGADVERVDVIVAARESDGGSDRLLSLERDMAALTAAAATGAYRLLVIDPITAYLDGADMNRQQDVRNVLQGLARLAGEANAAVVLVSHHRKQGEKGPAIYRTLGSLAFAAVARAVWNVVIDPSDPQRQLLVPVKMNLAPHPQGLAYRVAEPGVVLWEPRPIDLSADEVSLETLSDTDADDRLRQARIWLHGYLSDGPKRSADVKSAARQAGIPVKALWAAKAAMNVAAVRKTSKADRSDQYYEWRLPQDDFFDDGETEMLLAPSQRGVPGLDELIANLNDPSWEAALGRPVQDLGSSWNGGAGKGN